MQKKTSNLGLFSGLPKPTSEKAFREQLQRMPKLSGPSIAEKMVQLSKAPKAPKPSGSNPQG